MKHEQPRTTIPAEHSPSCVTPPCPTCPTVPAEQLTSCVTAPLSNLSHCPSRAAHLLRHSILSNLSHCPSKAPSHLRHPPVHIVHSVHTSIPDSLSDLSHPPVHIVHSVHTIDRWLQEHKQRVWPLYNELDGALGTRAKSKSLHLTVPSFAK